jgi:hypothetical protein
VYVNGKIRPVETLPEIGGEQIEGNDGEGEFNYEYIVRNFVNITICTQYNNNKNKFRKKFKNKLSNPFIT